MNSSKHGSVALRQGTLTKAYTRNRYYRYYRHYRQTGITGFKIALRMNFRFALMVVFGSTKWRSYRLFVRFSWILFWYCSENFHFLSNSKGDETVFFGKDLLHGSSYFEVLEQRGFKRSQKEVFTFYQKLVDATFYFFCMKLHQHKG